MISLNTDNASIVTLQSGKVNGYPLPELRNSASVCSKKKLPLTAEAEEKQASPMDSAQTSCPVVNAQPRAPSPATNSTQSSNTQASLPMPRKSSKDSVEEEIGQVGRRSTPATPPPQCATSPATFQASQTDTTDSIKRDPAYFINQLDTKTSDIKQLSTTAQPYLAITDLSAEAQGHVDSAIGAANLLIGGKFKQFRGLCEVAAGDRSNESGDAAPTSTDLQGFWELILIQVGKVEQQFKDVEAWKDNGWVEPVRKVPQKRRSRPSSRPNSRPPSRPDSATSNRKPQASSGLREQIRQARLAKKRAEAASKIDAGDAADQVVPSAIGTGDSKASVESL